MDAIQQKILELNNQQQNNAIEIPNMSGLQTEYSTSNKWYAYFPLANVLGSGYSNLELNIKRFSVPQMTMGSTSTTYKGYTYEFPTKLIDADSKEITLDYIVDEKWQNYRSFFKWCSATEGQINKIISTNDVNNIQFKDFVDCRIYLLDHFKNRIISFTFYNCWIKMFSELALDASNSEFVDHSITLAYSNYEITDC